MVRQVLRRAFDRGGKDHPGHYHVHIENVTMEGFKYNADKPILTDGDERPGKWAEELRKWKAAHE